MIHKLLVLFYRYVGVAVTLIVSSSALMVPYALHELVISPNAQRASMAVEVERLYQMKLIEDGRYQGRGENGDISQE